MLFGAFGQQRLDDRCTTCIPRFGMWRSGTPRIWMIRRRAVRCRYAGVQTSRTVPVRFTRGLPGETAGATSESRGAHGNR